MAEEALNGGVTVAAAAGDDNNGSKVAAPAVAFLAMKPWLVVEAPKANDAVQFYKSAFGAEEVSRSSHPKRKAEQEQPLVLSAELKLGSFVFVVSDLIEDSSPVQAAVTGVYSLETESVEAVIEKAVAAGGTALGEISEGEGACYGGRVGKLKDPFGNVWLICTPVAAKKADEVAAA